MDNKELPEEYGSGAVDFAGCKIDLSRKPLIPRPETEFWTRQAIIDLARRPKGQWILDIFSGSGCVGVAIAKHLESAHVDFFDIDRNAVEQIKINLEANGIGHDRAAVFESDIFSNIPAGNRYDAITANPPYVDPARIAQVQASVLKHEPHVALFGGVRGLEVIERFLKEAKNFLKPGGSIYMEFDPTQRDAVENIAKTNGYGGVAFYKDQYDVWRYARIMV
jgi:HemK-like putative methylase